MLVVFGGLPGVGKTTIARQVARETHATYLRIDTIEQSIRAANVLAGGVGAAGYLVAYALSETNLRMGRIVIADSVNPLEITRQSWRSVAAAAGRPVLQVEIICSDAIEHRRRIETRSIDVEGLKPPTWDDVLRRDYQPWSDALIRIDTAVTSAADAAALIVANMMSQRHQAQ